VAARGAAGTTFGGIVGGEDIVGCEAAIQLDV